MEYFNPTDARIILRNRLVRFLESRNPLFAIIGPACTGRKTIVNRLLDELDLTSEAEWCVSDSPAQFFESLYRSREAPLIVIKEGAITSAVGAGKTWYMDTLKRIRRRQPATKPEGHDEGDAVPAQLHLSQPVILIAEAQSSYDSTWNDIPGVAFDESGVDLHNYMQRERQSIIDTHNVSPESFDRIMGALRSLVRSRPECFSIPRPEFVTNVSRLIDGMNRLTAGDSDWNEVFRDLRGKQRGTCIPLDQFQILDGVRGPLVLPRMLQEFIQSEHRVFSFIVRYPVRMQRWHVRALEQFVPADRIHRCKGPDRARSLYKALVAAGDGGVVIADLFVEIAARSRDEISTITMLENVAAGAAVTRPETADQDLPKSVDFRGKLILVGEMMPESGTMHEFVHSHPGLHVQDSLSDVIHRQAWWDSDFVSEANSADAFKTLSANEWHAYLSSLFRFVNVNPEPSITRYNTGPTEGLLFSARDEIASVKGNLLKVRDTFVRNEMKTLNAMVVETGKPTDQTVESFERRSRSQSGP